MASQAQLEANRQNAQKSTGPRSEEGKFIASQNATIYGLTADRLIIRDEDRGQFDAFYAKLFHDLAPVGSLEDALAERIIALTWRCRRAEWMESSTLNVLLADKGEPEQSDDSFSKEKLHEMFEYAGCIIAESVLEPLNDKFDEVQREEKAEAINQVVVQNLSGLFNTGDREGPSPRTDLGRMVIKDFGGPKVIERFLRYQGEMERRLDKAILQLQRIQFVRKRNASIEAETQKNETNPISADSAQTSILKSQA